MILEALDVTVGLQWWEEDVEEPQADEQHGGQDFWCPGPAQLSADLWPPSVHQRGNTYKGKDGKERDGEGQCAWIHPEVTALGIVVDGGDGPSHLADISKASQNDTKMTHRTLTKTWHAWKSICGTHPNAQEHVNSIGAGHITDGGIGVLILDRSHLTGKSIWADKEVFCQGSAQWILPGQSLEILPSSVTLLFPPLVTDEEAALELPFTDKAADSLSECHWPDLKYVNLLWIDGDNTSEGPLQSRVKGAFDSWRTNSSLL